MKVLVFILPMFTCALLYGQIPTNGLIGGWPFTGNANDMTANANHGSVFGATLTTDRFNNPNCAYSFNGTSNYISMLNAGPTGTVSRSVSFWAKTTNTSIQVPFNYGNPSAAGGIWQIVANYNCTGYGFDQSTAAVIRGNNATVDNNWHHIVAIQNSTTGITVGSIAIYVDGVLQPSITCYVTSTVALINTNNVFPITIGKGSSSNVRYFKGDLDDFYFYDRVLSPAEVLQLYNDSPCTGPPNGIGAISGSLTVCSGIPTNYSVSPVLGATSYSWILPNGWSGSSISNSINVVTNGNPGTLSVCAVNACGQTSVTTLNVNSNPTPTVTINSDLNILCKGNLVTLYGSGANSYTWSNGSIIAPNITVSPTVSTTYSLSGSNGFGCINTTVKTITVTNNPLPTIVVSGPGPSCAWAPINLGANGALTYTWQPGNLNGFFISVSPSVTTAYTVTGTDANGCWNSTIYTQTVSICEGISELNSQENENSIFPNPFNDSFFIKFTSNTPSCIEVTNLYGALIFKQLTINEQIKIDLSGKENGVYFVKITHENNSSFYKIIKK